MGNCGNQEKAPAVDTQSLPLSDGSPSPTTSPPKSDDSPSPMTSPPESDDSPSPPEFEISNEDLAGEIDLSDYTLTPAAIKKILAEFEGNPVLVPVLENLCELISMSSDESLDEFPLEAAAELIVRAVREKSDPEVVTLAARAAANLLDAIPDSSNLFLSLQLVPALCSQLLLVEYIDLAEQCVQTLDYMSWYEPHHCLKEGAVVATLSNAQFFSIATQRLALSTVANMCETIPLDCSGLVMDVVPTLSQFLLSEDRKTAEAAAASLMSITKCFSGSSELLEQLCKYRVIDLSIQLITSNSQETISEATRIGLIRLLSTLASGSLTAVRTLLELNISSILKDIFATCDFSDSKVRAAVKLLNQIIPPFTRDDQNIQLLLGKEKLIVDQPKLLQQLTMDILPVLIKVAMSDADSYVCYGCASVINGIVYISTPEILLDSIRNTNISSLLACLLARKNSHLLFLTLKTIELLMQKLPGVLSSSFIKEGVTYAIDALLVPQDRSECTDHQSINIQDANEETAPRSRSRCLCYAFGSYLDSSSSEAKTCKLSEDAVHSLAKQIRATYFTESASSEILQNLKGICKQLNGLISDDSPENEEILTDILKSITEELNWGETLSTFEFTEIGIVGSLAHYLTNGKYLHRSPSDHHYVNHTVSVLKRFQKFTYMSSSKSSPNREDMPLGLLVRNLQNALAYVEHYNVILSYASNPKRKTTDIPVGRTTEHPCLQVRFVREEGETDLREYKKIFTIELSSSFNAIEEVLGPKVIINDSATISDLSSTDGLAESNNDRLPKLIFFYNGKQIDQSMTIYQVILQDRMKTETGFKVSRSFWKKKYRITYRKAEELTADASRPSDAALVSWQKLPFFTSLLAAELPCKLERSTPSYDVLFMLKVLEGLNRFSSHLLTEERINAFSEGRIEDLDDLKVPVSSVPQGEFISTKLTNKMERQMSDSLVLTTGCMPSWCTHLMDECSFLFPFETRWKYFCLTTFGSTNVARHSNRTDVYSVNDHQTPEEFPREKVQVNRNDVLGSAADMMASNASKKGLIEVEFNGEIGTGLGPTKEFYTLVSHEFQQVGLGMWRGDQSSSSVHLGTSKVFGDSGFIIASSGLFPRPWRSTESIENGIQFSQVIKKFFLIGQLVARTIKDGRILDLPFARAIYKVIVNQELDLYDIKSFDPEFGRALIEFQALARRNSFAQSRHRDHPIDLSFRGARLEDLCLDFTLPGYPDYPLKSGSNPEMVTLNNLQEYVELVVDATIGHGVRRQLDALKSGFNEVFPIKDLLIFTEDELDGILNGEESPWDLSKIRDHIKFDHGYTADSPHVVNLLEIIRDFSYNQRRSFFQFLTGSPRLPPGGLEALNPKLTIVRKHCDNDDMELPSVMTCVNYLKLPPYSSKERMREKLLYAMMEGQGSFHLS